MKCGLMQMFVIELPFDSLIDDTLNMLPSAQEFSACWRLAPHCTRHRSLYF